MESTKNTRRKDDQVEADIDVLEEEIETGKILLTDNKKDIDNRNDRTGVKVGDGGGGATKIGSCSGCPVLSRCV